MAVQGQKRRLPAFAAERRLSGRLGDLRRDAWQGQACADSGHSSDGFQTAYFDPKMVYRGGCGSALDAERASPSVTMFGSRLAWPRASRKERSDGAFRWT